MLAHVAHGHDSRMLQAGERSRLALKPSRRLSVQGEGDHLDRHALLGRRVEAHVDRAHAALAAVYQGSLSRDFTSGIGEWTRSLGLAPDDILPRVKRYLRQAGEAPGPLVHQVASQLRSYQGRHDEALAEAGRGIALDENDPLGHEAMAAALIFAGRPEEGAGAIGTAMRLDPQYPHEYLFWLGLAQFGMERFDQAARTLTRAVEPNPDDDRALIVLAAAWGHGGRAAAATAAIDTLNNALLRVGFTLRIAPLETAGQEDIA